MSRALRLAVIAGDGIGRDVVPEALRALDAARQRFGFLAEIEPLPWGADYYLSTGVTVPAGGYESLARDFDAIFVGALGDPRVPDNRHAREILLGTRVALDLYVNYRPVTLLDARLCPLKDRTPDDVRFVVFRENTEGMYVDAGGRLKPGTEDEVAIQEEINTYKGVRRIVEHAFAFARATGRARVCMADKSNALTHGHALWQRVFKEVVAAFPDIEARHMYIDALALLMIRDPGQFEVIVTNNLFGDIVTDIGAALQGGLGMAASANLHPGRTGLFEPVHGSAPPLAGRNVANPCGAVLSMALLLRDVGYPDAAQSIEDAVAGAVCAGACTADVGGPLGTREAADAIIERILKPPA